MRSVRFTLRTLLVPALLTVCFATAVSAAPAATAAAPPSFVRLQTGAGDILLVFYPELAPLHVGNFKHLAGTGFFDGSRFHRIVPGFVIQGGDPNSKDDDPSNDGQGGPQVQDVLTAKEWQAYTAADSIQGPAMLAAKGYAAVNGKATLKAEFSATVKHLRGTLSMARAQPVDSAGSQFFICVADTPMLDGKYTVFGHVVSGMEVADKIVSAEKNPVGRDAPAVPVQILKATVIDGTEGLTAAERKAWDALPATLKNVR
jgi:cyclophilin family peptidyl-prolyl cis-trans isomerase